MGEPGRLGKRAECISGGAVSDSNATDTALESTIRARVIVPPVCILDADDNLSNARLLATECCGGN
jgi:hypothetical protein